MERQASLDLSFSVGYALYIIVTDHTWPGRRGDAPHIAALRYVTLSAFAATQGLCVIKAYREQSPGGPCTT